MGDTQFRISEHALYFERKYRNNGLYEINYDEEVYVESVNLTRSWIKDPRQIDESEPFFLRLQRCDFIVNKTFIASLTMKENIKDTRKYFNFVAKKFNYWHDL